MFPGFNVCRSAAVLTSSSAAERNPVDHGYSYELGQELSSVCIVESAGYTTAGRFYFKRVGNALDRVRDRFLTSRYAFVVFS